MSKEQDTAQSPREKLARIDWNGAITLSFTILFSLVVLDMGGQKYSFTHPFIISAIVIAIVSGVGFVITEKYYAKEPVFPLQLLCHYVVITSYSIMFLQTFAQTAVSFLRIFFYP